MAIFLTITSDRWRGNTLVSGIEDPVSTEGNIRTVKHHRTRYIELPSIYSFA